MYLPLVSIIIPTYNRASILGKTLNSVLAQTYIYWECIVVDDGSEDNTDQLMKHYCKLDDRFTYVHRPDSYQSGGNGARNYGLDIAKGNLINWFDSDDWMHPDKLQAQLQLFSENQTLQVCICSGKKMNPLDQSEEPLRQNFEADLFTQVAENSSEIITNAFILKKDFVHQHNLRFDEQLHRGQETDFLLQIIKVVEANEIGYTERQLFSYVFTEDSKSKKDEQYNSQFKWSRATIYLDMLSMSKTTQYQDIFKTRLKRILRIYFSALQHNDRHTSVFIIKRLEHILGKSFHSLYKQLRWVAAVNRFAPLPTNKLRVHFQEKAMKMLENFDFNS